MTNGNRMTRRDWFRLSPRRAETDVTAGRAADDATHSMGDVPPGLQPIAHPENHDGMNLAELPPMREAVLSDEQVRQLFADIEALASDILLMQRSSRSQRATASRATTATQLRTALETLLAGNITRVQVRYNWQSANWIDTLERRADGVRLVRITHAPAASARHPPTQTAD